MPEKIDLDNPSEQEKAQMVEDMILLRHAVRDFSGYMPHLQHAIGAYIVGREVGWKPLFLMNDLKTMRRAEKLLSVKLSDCLDDVGPYAYKSIAWSTVQIAGKFWQTVKGEISGIRSGWFGNNPNKDDTAT